MYRGNIKGTGNLIANQNIFRVFSMVLKINFHSSKNEFPQWCAYEEQDPAFTKQPATSPEPMDIACHRERPGPSTVKWTHIHLTPSYKLYTFCISINYWFNEFPWQK